MTNTSNSIVTAQTEKLRLLRSWREALDDQRVLRVSEGKDAAEMVAALTHYDEILKFEQTRL